MAKKAASKAATKSGETPSQNGGPILSFEEAIEELETITRQLESGSLSLDESIKAYEKGMQLRQVCREKLEQAEKKLEYLERRDDGSLDKQAIDTDEDGDDRDATEQSRLFQ